MFELERSTLINLFISKEHSIGINNVYSTFLGLISGVPQGSVLGALLFRRLVLYLLITKASLHNYAYDKLNPIKFQAMLVSKRQNIIPEELTICISDVDIKSKNSVKLLEITLDNKLSFENHINSICKSASCQLNALFRLKNFLGFKEMKILIYSNFNYCLLVWHFCNQKSSQKVENLQKRALQFLQNDYTSSCTDLLENLNKSIMTIQRLRTLCLEIFKTLRQLNPS